MSWVRTVVLFLLVGSFALSSLVHGQWMPTNGPSGGSVNSFAVLGNKIFAGTQEIGVLVSTDGGANWTSASAALSQTHITALARSGPNLFAGTFYAQIYRSTDSGINWTLLNTGAYDEIRAFEVTGGSIYAAAGLSGVLRSDDDGTSWTKVSLGLTTNYVNAFAAIDSDLYAAGYGVFRSTNKGETWTPFSDGLIDSECFTLTAIGTNLFVGTNGGTYVAYHGLPWNQAGSILPNYSPATNTLLAVGKDLFAATFYGVFQTTDNGLHWNAINSNFADSTNVAQLATNGVNIFAGTFYGAATGVWRRPLSDFGINSAVQIPAKSASQIRCYPNPIFHSTTLSFTPATSGYAEVSVVNLLGVEIVRLFSGELAAGKHNFIWSNTSGLPDGMYECLARMNGKVEKLPMVLLH